MELEEEIVSDKIELAVLQFKSKNYEQCAALYSELIHKLSSLRESQIIQIRRYHQLSEKPAFGKVVHPKLCGIYDQRAATYEKLGSTDMAFQDARRVISIDPVNCKGYLRLAKLYHKSGDRIKSYKTYQQGVYMIRKASETHGYEPPERLWHSLQAAYKDLNRSLKEEREKFGKSSFSADLKNADSKNLSSQYSSVGLQSQLDKMLPLKRVKKDTPAQGKRPKVCRDIFLVFPREVIELVFVYLPFSGVLRAHVVCRLWYNTLTTLPLLYKDRFILKHRITVPEYFHGLKLIKKVSAHSFSKSIGSVRVWSTYNIHHLGKIIESIISDQTLKLSRIHIIDKNLSMELVLQKLERCKWDYSSLATVRHLRLGINSSLYDGTILFTIFPFLDTLEVLCVDSQHRKANMSIVPHSSDTYTELVEISRKIKTQSTLQKLSLVNNPNLKREVQSTRPGDKSFNPSPAFLDISFPSLTELKITNYDFTGMAVVLQAFLRETPFLTYLYFEDNEELPLKKFILLIASCAPSFKLKKFTFRELQQEVNYNIDEVSLEELACFHGLTHLDIYGSSISKSGFLQFLAICNTGELLQSLNIGHSGYIQFRNDSFAAPHTVLTFSQLFTMVPQIEALILPELSLDNFSVRLLKEAIDEIFMKTGRKTKLTLLDLSFCSSIDGTGLMNLFRSSNGQEKSKFSLNTLILDGLHFKPETLEVLKRKEFAKSVQNDPHRKKWRAYGINSQVLETD